MLVSARLSVFQSGTCYLWDIHADCEKLMDTIQMRMQVAQQKRATPQLILGCPLRTDGVVNFGKSGTEALSCPRERITLGGKKGGFHVGPVIRTASGQTFAVELNADTEVFKKGESGPIILMAVLRRRGRRGCALGREIQFRVQLGRCRGRHDCFG